MTLAWRNAWRRWPNPVTSTSPNRPRGWSKDISRPATSGASRSRARPSRLPCPIWEGLERSAPASTGRAPAACPPSSAAIATWRSSEAALERTRNGGQVLGIMAEAGAGKSRLCAEFLGHCRAQGLSVLEGRGVAHGKAIPMLPILELWRAYYGIIDADPPETARAKISGRLLSMDEGYREDLPFIFDLFGVPDPANPAPAIDPGTAPEAPARRGQAGAARSRP